jgi:hypothetical protein
MENNARKHWLMLAAKWTRSDRQHVAEQRYRVSWFQWSYGSMTDAPAEHLPLLETPPVPARTL